MIRIGPAGNSESFTAMGYKSTPQIPEYLEKMGLNAYEYQCGRGVRINREGVLKLKAGCEARDIQLSLHAPYYISLSSVEEEKRQNSIKYILESAEAADLMSPAASWSTPAPVPRSVGRRRFPLRERP